MASIDDRELGGSLLVYTAILFAAIHFGRPMDEGFTYGFLETAGYPRLSMFTVWPLMGGVGGALTCIRNWFDR